MNKIYALICCVRCDDELLQRAILDEFGFRIRFKTLFCFG